MKAHESETFKRFGSFFFLLLLGLGVLLPLVIALPMSFGEDGFRVDVFLPMALVFAFIIWMTLAIMLGYGSLTSLFVKRTAKRISDLPYRFNSSFKSRSGMLFIDVEHGMIAFISAYNPLELQVFNASRVSKAKTLSSAMTGIRFIFYVDEKKITMFTLLSNKVVSTKSGIGAEAVSKADTFVELLLAAKAQAELQTGVQAKR